MNRNITFHWTILPEPSNRSIDPNLTTTGCPLLFKHQMSLNHEDCFLLFLVAFTIDFILAAEILTLLGMFLA